MTAPAPAPTVTDVGPLRHAVCFHRRSEPLPWPALCGSEVTERVDHPTFCAVCVDLADSHIDNCDCWKARA